MNELSKTKTKSDVMFKIALLYPRWVLEVRPGGGDGPGEHKGSAQWSSERFNDNTFILEAGESAFT